MINATEYTFQQLNHLSLKASVYRSHKEDADHTILYFHGGGLVYGESNDLPEEYISFFLDAGFHFIAFDYPLAPEMDLPRIYRSTKKAVEWFIDTAETELSFSNSSYSLFGRSAGAYLCFLLAADSTLPKAKRLIDFYGYHSLKYEEFEKPNHHYRQYPVLQKTMIQRMIQSAPLVSGPIQTRYALYIYARQHGNWMNFLGVSDPVKKDAWSLTESDLKLLPPTFIAHSTSDKDVPYAIAEELSRKIPIAQLFTVHGREHDFDRQTTLPESKNAYHVLLEWLCSDG